MSAYTESAAYQARKAAWVAEQLESAPPLSDRQAVIIRAAWGSSTKNRNAA